MRLAIRRRYPQVTSAPATTTSLNPNPPVDHAHRASETSPINSTSAATPAHAHAPTRHDASRSGYRLSFQVVRIKPAKYTARYAQPLDTTSRSVQRLISGGGPVGETVGFTPLSSRRMNSASQFAHVNWCIAS